MEINFTISSFPVGYCFTTPNQFAVDLVTRLAGEVAGDANFFNDGDTTPAPDDQDRPWLPHNYSGNNPPAFVYQFVDGAWRMPNPNPTGAVMMYQGTEASIETFDGGEAGAITATTGPMWQKVSAMDAKIPIGPGTLGTAPNTRTIAIGGTLGEDKVTLIEENIPIDEIIAYSEAAGANLATVGLIADDDRNSSPNPDPIHSFGGDINGATVAHENMPPVYGIWFIVRTARKFYRR